MRRPGPRFERLNCRFERSPSGSRIWRDSPVYQLHAVLLGNAVASAIDGRAPGRSGIRQFADVFDTDDRQPGRRHNSGHRRRGLSVPDGEQLAGTSHDIQRTEVGHVPAVPMNRKPKSSVARGAVSACRRCSVPMRTSAPMRRGAVAFEGAVVIGVFLVILYGMLDLGLAVLQQNTLSEEARRLARAAIVHGSKASPKSTTWGPGTISGSASGSSEAAGVVSPVLIAMDPSSVQFTLEWLDGD